MADETKNDLIPGEQADPAAGTSQGSAESAGPETGPDKEPEKKAKTKEVVVVEMGFYNGAMVMPGKKLTVPVKLKGKWFTDADKAPTGKGEKPKKKEPETLRELGKVAARDPIGLQDPNKTN